jgi:hypothetical protein
MVVGSATVVIDAAFHVRLTYCVESFRTASVHHEGAGEKAMCRQTAGKSHDAFETEG